MCDQLIILLFSSVPHSLLELLSVLRWDELWVTLLPDLTLNYYNLLSLPTPLFSPGSLLTNISSTRQLQEYIFITAEVFWFFFRPNFCSSSLPENFGTSLRKSFSFFLAIQLLPFKFYISAPTFVSLGKIRTWTHSKSLKIASVPLVGVYCLMQASLIRFIKSRSMLYYFGLLKCNILNLDVEIILEIAIRCKRTTWSWLIKEWDAVGQGLQQEYQG